MGEITNEVLLEKIENLKEQNKEDHIRIEGHVIRTNGSVASLKTWRAYTAGAIAVLTALIVPIMFMFIAEYIKR